MPPKSTRKNAPFNRDLELSRRISALRASKRMTQRQFAEKLDVTQAQISEWEKEGGTEQPSVEKLIALGNLASDSAERMFFWRRAGLSEGRLREDLPADFLQMLDRREASFSAPLVKNVFLGAAGQVLTESEGAVAIPSMLLSGVASVYCMQVPEYRIGPPPTFRAGDYVLIERSPEIVDGLERSLVAVYLENTPEGYEADPRSPALEHFRHIVEQSRELSEADLLREKQRREEEERLNDLANPAAAREAEDRNDRLAAEYERLLREPILLFGRLVIQEAGDPARETNFRARPSRVALELGAYGSLPVIMPLGEWEIGHNPLEPKIASRLRSGVHILGPVIGWFEDRSRYRKLGGETR